MDNLWIGNAEIFTRILITAPLFYLIIIIYIKLFGKRTTSQMNSFDWIVTVAMGSIVASTVLTKSVPILAGALAIFMLMLMQFVLTKLMVNSTRIRNLARTTPRLLVFQGEFLIENMHKERITQPEIYAAIREKGITNINEVYAVVLETDGKFSVISMSKNNTTFSLAHVEGVPYGLKKDLEQAKKSSSK